jgi:hypothetical protein
MDGACLGAQLSRPISWTPNEFPGHVNGMLAHKVITSSGLVGLALIFEHTNLNLALEFACFLIPWSLLVLGTFKKLHTSLVLVLGPKLIFGWYGTGICLVLRLV